MSTKTEEKRLMIRGIINQFDSVRLSSRFLDVRLKVPLAGMKQAGTIWQALCVCRVSVPDAAHDPSPRWVRKYELLW